MQKVVYLASKVNKDEVAKWAVLMARIVAYQKILSHFVERQIAKFFIVLFCFNHT